MFVRSLKFIIIVDYVSAYICICNMCTCSCMWLYNICIHIFIYIYTQKLSKREPSGHPRLWSLTLLLLIYIHTKIQWHVHVKENITYDSSLLLQQFTTFLIWMVLEIVSDHTPVLWGVVSRVCSM